MQQKHNRFIAGMCLVLILLLTRLFLINEHEALQKEDLDFSETFAPAAVKEKTEETIQESPSYVFSYPELYAEPLKEFSSPGDGKKIAFLTFDDGPSSKTCEVLDVLREENIKATFFIVGDKISESGKICLAQMIKDGHSIGLHAYSHEYGKLYASVDTFLTDYDKLFKQVYDITGVKPSIYRFPGGSCTSFNKKIKNAVIAEMERRGFVYYDWNVSAEDSVGRPSSYSIMKNIRKDVFRFQCPVILMHDSEINALTVKLLPDIIKELREAGYEFDTLNNREPCQF